jgi:sister-chromatid-cohesion protein PDS5
LDEDSDLTEFQNAHFLILEINKFASGILLNVIPQLEEELKV